LVRCLAGMARLEQPEQPKDGVFRVPVLSVTEPTAGFQPPHYDFNVLRTPLS